MNTTDKKRGDTRKRGITKRPCTSTEEADPWPTVDSQGKEAEEEMNNTMTTMREDQNITMKAILCKCTEEGDRWQ